MSHVLVQLVTKLFGVRLCELFRLSLYVSMYVCPKIHIRHALSRKVTVEINLQVAHTGRSQSEDREGGAVG